MGRCGRCGARDFPDCPESAADAVRSETLRGVAPRYAFHQAMRYLNHWLQPELSIRLPILPLPNDPFTLTMVATPTSWSVPKFCWPKEAAEEPKERRQEQEPIIRIREQKSP